MFGQSSSAFRNLPLLWHMIIFSASIVRVVSGDCVLGWLGYFMGFIFYCCGGIMLTNRA